MDKAINRHIEKLDKELLLGKSGSQRTHQNQCKVCAVTSDGQIVVRCSQKTTLAELEILLKLFSHRTETSHSVRIPKSLFKTDMFRLENECLRSLCRSLHELLRTRFQDAATAIYVKLKLPS